MWSFHGGDYEESCVSRRLRGTYRLHLHGREIRERGTSGSRWLQSAAKCSRWFLPRGLLYPEDGGDTFLRNIGSHKIYTEPHSIRRHSSKSVPGCVESYYCNGKWTLHWLDKFVSLANVSLRFMYVLLHGPSLRRRWIHNTLLRYSKFLRDRAMKT
jgi:hypothetical protein